MSTGVRRKDKVIGVVLREQLRFKLQGLVNDGTSF